MIHLSSDLLNSPERILDELEKTKQEINRLLSLECSLKDELEHHLKDGTIKEIFKYNGVTVNRLQTRQKYVFSVELRNLEDRYKSEIENKKELEILDGNYTKKLETQPYWRVTFDK